MPEVPPDFPRAWIEFTDPDDPRQLFRCDLTWLTSSWTCIFGQGCAGILAERPDDGCCSLGAHFSDRADERRVRRWSKALPADVWQLRATARKGGVSEIGEDGDRRTRLVDGACLFLNRPGFAGGAGCALHLFASRRGLDHHQVKPDVCWQLPLRRSYDEVTGPDETERLVVTIGEYDRAGWGPGGHDLDWYCSGNTDAHVGAQPLFISEEAALRELMGVRAYDILAAYCEARVAGLARVRTKELPHVAPHPADQGQ